MTEGGIERMERRRGRLELRDVVGVKWKMSIAQVDGGALGQYFGKLAMLPTLFG